MNDTPETPTIRLKLGGSGTVTPPQARAVEPGTEVPPITPIPPKE